MKPTIRRMLMVVLGAFLVFKLGACSDTSKESTTSKSNTEESICTSKGAKPGKLGPHTVCVFEDNRQCSIAALINGRCIEYGYKITGYENDQQAFCAVSGYDADFDEMLCHISDTQSCSLESFYAGECP